MSKRRWTESWLEILRANWWGPPPPTSSEGPILGGLRTFEEAGEALTQKSVERFHLNPESRQTPKKEETHKKMIFHTTGKLFLSNNPDLRERSAHPHRLAEH